MPQQTPLFLIHQQLGAKLVEFGGWKMPVSYSGVLKEHHAVRNAMGLFDVSHMGELFIEGPQAFEFLQWVTCNDVGLLKDGDCQYTLLTHPEGGVIDDVILYRLSGQQYFFCVNAANIEKDFDWLLRCQQGFEIQIVNRSADYALLALQGPQAIAFLKNQWPAAVIPARSFSFVQTEIANRTVLLSRTGYTGEDGVEIYCAAVDVQHLWAQILERGLLHGLLPCGLGCRDTLRLEMAYPLYGHELTDEINPLEAGLGWVVKLSKGDFISRQALELVRKKGLQKKRVGFVMQEKAIARQDYPIFLEGEKIGWVTSGSYSPSIDKNIGCGYVPANLAFPGSTLEVEVRGRFKKAEVVKTPFYTF